MAIHEDVNLRSGDNVTIQPNLLLSQKTFVLVRVRARAFPRVQYLSTLGFPVPRTSLAQDTAIQRIPSDIPDLCIDSYDFSPLQ